MKTAERIIGRLADGEDFAKLARIHSKDDQSDNGGEYGWLKRTELRKELADTAFSLRRGQYSNPLPSRGPRFHYKGKRETF